MLKHPGADNVFTRVLDMSLYFITNWFTYLFNNSVAMSIIGILGAIIVVHFVTRFLVERR